MDNMFIGKFTIGQTLDRGFRLYKKTLGKSVILLFLPAILGMLNMNNMLSLSGSQNPFAMFTPLYFIALIIGVWAWIIIVRYLYQMSLGNELDFNEVVKLAVPSDFLLMISTIIWGIFMVLCFIALILPLFYVLNIYIIGSIIIVVEKKYFISGIMRTFSLTKGRWWKTFLINLVTYIITIGPMFLSAMLFMGGITRSLLNDPSTLSNTSSVQMTPMVIIGSILYMAVITLIGPLFIAINIVHYNSLRSEKENLDIDSQLDSFGEVTAENV